jgi:TolB-like protein
MSLFTELQQRNVFKVGITYAAVAWLLLQLISTLQEPLRLPDWTLNLFLALALFGFPLALILAWALELSAEGLARESSEHTSTGARVKFGLLMLLVVIGVTGGLFFNWHRVEPVAPVAIQHSNNPQGLTSTTRAVDKSIAVLPFVNMSADADNEYFSDGIAEELLHGLAKLEDLRVAARTSSFYFKGKNIDIREIGQKLNVATVLEGSVRRAGDRVRITAQLINISDGYHLWSATYDRTLDDIFAIQDEIALAIVDELKVELGVTGAANIGVHKGTDNPAAYEAYLQGVYHTKIGGQDGIVQAATHFTRAVELDPNYANGWGYLASTYMNLSMWEDFDDIGPRAREAFDHALALDPGNGEALTAKGDYTLRTTWDWRAAQSYYALALQSEADRAHILSAYVNVILIPLGQTDTARQLMQEADLNDPYSVPIKVGLGLVALTDQRWQDAVARGKELRKLNTDLPGSGVMCMAYRQMGDWDSMQALVDHPDGAETMLCKLYLASSEGNAFALNAISASMAVAAKFNPLAAFASIVIASARGNVDGAIDGWEALYERQSPFTRFVRAIPSLEDNWAAIQREPRYQALLKKVNLDDASIAEYERTIDF